MGVAAACGVVDGGPAAVRPFPACLRGRKTLGFQRVESMIAKAYEPYLRQRPFTATPGLFLFTDHSPIKVRSFLWSKGLEVRASKSSRN